MGTALIFIFLLLVLTAFFKKVSDWFEYTKNINILPAAFIEMIAVIVFMFTYGSKSTDEIIWMWVSILVVVVITVFNLIRYGLKDGILASITELVFSISVALLLASILISSGNKTKNKKS